MQPDSENTKPRYSARDLYNERQSLAAKIRTLKNHKRGGNNAHDRAIEMAATAVENEN